MNIAHATRALADQRGTALPLAMLALLILSTLIIGFSVLSATEPTIANNHLRVAQARAMAEAGVERAIWALNRGITDADDANGIPTTFTTAPSPYDASQFVPLTANGVAGGFRVTVTNGPALYERTITAVGWVPNDTTTLPKAHQKITVVVYNPQFIMKDPPAALSVRGELQMGGNSLVDSRQDASCGRKLGTVTTGPTYLDGNATDVYGAATGPSDPNLDVRNQVTDAANGPIPTNGMDVVKNVAKTLPTGTPGLAFDQFILTDDDINVLRAYAKARGTYIQGEATFNSSNQLPNGVVFIDTVSGTNITKEGVTPPTPTSDFASVSIHGNAGSSPDGAFNGLLFVNGSLSISGNFRMNGFAYSQNDISYHGTGTGLLTGAMFSRNIRDMVSTSIDSDVLGNAAIVYNCQAARTGGGSVVGRWLLKSGSYKEISGS
jgi:hypothetical protein